MKLAKKIAKLEDVPEGYRGLYAKEGDVFVRSGADELELPDPAPALAGNRDDILREKRELQERFKDVDPDEYKRLKAAESERATKELADKGSYDAAVTALKQTHETETATLKTQLNQLMGGMRSQSVEAEAMKAFSATGGKRDKLILPEGGGGPVRSRVEWVETAAGSGVFNMVVKGLSGQPLAADAAKGSPMAQLISELRATDDYGAAWDATGMGGSGSPGGRTGAPGGTGATATVTRAMFDGMDAAGKQAHVAAGGVVSD